MNMHGGSLQSHRLYPGVPGTSMTRPYFPPQNPGKKGTSRGVNVSDHCL